MTRALPPPLSPLLYLDIDDTVIRYREGHPRAAPGAREFLLWALENFEVRWLTTWCPSGEMEESLLLDLAKMLRLDPGIVRGIDACAWDDGNSKLNGIAWVDHLVMGRPFLWVEDEYGVGPGELRFLSEHGLGDRYECCNVSRDAGALRDLHRRLRARPPEREHLLRPRRSAALPHAPTNHGSDDE